MTEVSLFSYALSCDEMVQTWIDVNERFGHVLVIYEPLKHLEYFKQINLPYAPDDVYTAELLVLEFTCLDDCREVLYHIDHTKGPFAQMWSLGKLLTDNIEINPLTK